MFKKIYKEANDEIYINENLIDDIFTKAKNQTTKKQKTLNYRYIYSTAAAILLVIGCSAAITELTSKPIPETESIPIPVKKTETVISDRDLNDTVAEDSIYNLYGDETSAKSVKETTDTKVKSKKIAPSDPITIEEDSVIAPVQNPEEGILSVASAEIEEVIPASEPVQNAEQITPADSDETEKITSTQESTPIQRNMMSEPSPASESYDDSLIWSSYISNDFTENSDLPVQETESPDTQDNLTNILNLPPDFSLTDKSEGYYEYSGDNDKSFEIYKNTTPPQDTVLSFTDNGDEYSVTANNMSASEIEDIFINLE